MKIQSVQRAIDILSLFSKSRPTYSLTEIANALGLKISTVHGIVSTLEQNGFLRTDLRTRQYRLGSKLLELGGYFGSSLEINLHAASLAQGLAQRVNLNVRVGIWDANSVLITLFAFPQGTANSAYNFGSRLSPYCTAIGRAILAFIEKEVCISYLEREQFVKHTKYTLTTMEAILADLDEIRERGYAINRGESSLSRAGIAAPIWGPGKKLEGGLSITGRTQEILGENMRVLADDLLYAAFEISGSMGFVV